MTDARLLIPLDCLPGPVQVGAPFAYETRHGYITGVVAGRTPDGAALGVDTGCPHPWSVFGMPDVVDLYLDISPPLLVDGYPTRIDGAHVAAEMLARAMAPEGWTGGAAGHWSAAALDRTMQRPNPRGMRLWLPVDYSHPGPGPWTSADRRVLSWCCDDVPALADIDPASPNADRLALAAVLRARPWSAK